MKALRYNRSVVRYLLSRLLARWRRRSFFPFFSPLKLAEVPFNPPAGWVELEPVFCGICGSDVNLLKGAESFLLEPYASLPSILGHEIVAKVAAALPGCDLKPGERVLVEPCLPCETRGLPNCPNCQKGRYNLCQNFLTGSLPPGSFLGFNKAAGGGMAERTAAHPSRILRLPENLSNHDAVLTDSLASALQPLLDNFPEPGETVLVYGAGILGQHMVRLLKHLDCRAKVVCLARHPFQAEAALAGGADVALTSPKRKELALAVGGKFIASTLGGGNIEGGADLVFDCVGGSRSLEDGLLCLRAAGRYVMVGTASVIAKADVSSLWFRELRITGSSGFSSALYQGKRVRTYQLAMDILASGLYPVKGLLTHTFALSEYRAAFQVAFDKSSHKSLKVAFDLRKQPAKACPPEPPTQGE